MEGVFWAILERLVLDIARHFLLVVPVARVSGAPWWLLCVLDVVISFRLCPSCWLRGQGLDSGSFGHGATAHSCVPPGGTHWSGHVCGDSSFVPSLLVELLKEAPGEPVKLLRIKSGEPSPELTRCRVRRHTELSEPSVVEVVADYSIDSILLVVISTCSCAILPLGILPVLLLSRENMVAFH